MQPNLTGLICMTILGATLGVAESKAQVTGSTIIEPGSVHVFEKGEGFTEEVSDCPGIDRCWIDVDLDGRHYKAEAQITIGGLFTTHRAKFTVYNTFTLAPSSRPLVNETRLSASVSGEIKYEGVVKLGGSVGETSSEIRIVARLRDLTDNKTIAEKVIVDRACEGSGFLGDVGCVKRPTGSSVYNLAATLIRGHVYEIDIVGQCKAKIDSAAGAVICNFYEQRMGEDPFPISGIKATPITVSVEEDLREEVMELREDLELLKNKYEDHSHTYRTGPGKGHNSDAAVSGKPQDN